MYRPLLLWGLKSRLMTGTNGMQLSINPTVVVTLSRILVTVAIDFNDTTLKRGEAKQMIRLPVPRHQRHRS